METDLLFKCVYNFIKINNTIKHWNTYMYVCPLGVQWVLIFIKNCVCAKWLSAFSEKLPKNIFGL